MYKNLIIVAGGSGKRMGEKTPKQFLEIKNKPILLHTLERFYNHDNQMNIVIVLPEDHIPLWERILLEKKCTIPHQIVEGGAERFYSVKNGLNKIDTTGLVAIHDGVRPFVSDQTIQNCFIEAEKRGNAIPVIKVNESVRQVEANTNRVVDRESIRLIQTPQVFNVKMLKKAYDQKFSREFTDDASVVERMGEKIHLVEGNSENIKITRPNDLLLAELFCSKFAIH